MSMKVFNLRCANEHAFEGWFGSAEDFDSQVERRLVECPMCGDHAVSRLPSAPRLNLSGAQPSADAAQPAPTAEQLRALWLKVAQHIRESTEDVGERFSEEARRIHYREAPARGIRGVASREDAEALADEGIEVFSFPMPRGPKGPLQ
jgi:hypothetical protein